MIWDREAGHTGNLKGSLQCCGADSDASGLCPEHAAFVADARDLTGIDRKYHCRVSGRKAPKLGTPNVKHTVEPPSPRRLEYVAWKAEHAKQDKGFIQWALDEDKRAIAASEPSPFTADGQSKIARARAAEPSAETVCGFRFEYRAEGGSGFYWKGKRVASTREGLERMGPAILARVCK
jgi:hypothetical protein